MYMTNLHLDSHPIYVIHSPPILSPSIAQRIQQEQMAIAEKEQREAYLARKQAKSRERNAIAAKYNLQPKY